MPRWVQVEKVYLTPETLPTTTCDRTISIPNDPTLLAAVNAALYSLTLPENWEQYGAITPEQAAEAMQDAFLAYLGSDCT